jgi:hypothetical protein
VASHWRRRKNGSDTWHNSSNCQHWPTTDYEVSADPSSGEKCNECLGKKRNNNCS